MADSPCSNPDCSVAQNGKCIEGFDVLTECPHYMGDAVAEDDSETSQAMPVLRRRPAAHSNQAAGYDRPLTMQEATTVLTQHDTRVIACVGSQAVGKTSLFASIYERLHQQPIGRYQFAGSRTLYPFEQLAFSARMEAGGSKPAIPRTVREDTAHFYHLAFVETPKYQRIDLLLADRAGEEYSDAMDSHDQCLSLFEIRRANTVLILVDGSLLADQALRHDARQKAVFLVRAIHNAGLLAHCRYLGVVLTKYDKAIAAREMVDHEIAKTTDQIKEIVAADRMRVEMLITAALPEETGTIHAGYGIEELINFVTLPAFLGRFKSPEEGPHPITRYFHRLRFAQ